MTGADHTLLGGKVALNQPDKGFRAAIDSVFLGAFVPAKGGERVLDVGTGSGAAALCLMARCPDVQVTGVEKLPESADFARANAALNGLESRYYIEEADLAALPPSLKEKPFDHVMTNPPFMPTCHPAPPNPSLAAATVESLPLIRWVDLCLKRLKPKGSFTIVHRADRLDDILTALHGKAGAIEIFPLYPRAGEPARRVLVRAKKESATPLILRPGMVIHPPEGQGYTAEAEAVLRGGKSL